MSDMHRAGWTPLHQAALDEALGKAVSNVVTSLLLEGADPHAPDSTGETPFNIAAPASPVTGRLMTLHWLDQAMRGQGTKGINDVSGAHGSTLAQYMAKWLNDGEIDSLVTAGVAAGMKVDVPNKSGWTPLAAAAAMGRVGAVTAFLRHYTSDAASIRTTEAYTADYGHGRVVTYPPGITAAQLAQARMEQDKALSEKEKNDLARVSAAILLFIAG